MHSFGDNSGSCGISGGKTGWGAGIWEPAEPCLLYTSMPSRRTPLFPPEGNVSTPAPSGGKPGNQKALPPANLRRPSNLPTWTLSLIHICSPIREELLHGDRLAGLQYAHLSADRPVILIIGAVSYTHLDVYKRQTGKPPFLQTGIPAPKE